MSDSNQTWMLWLESQALRVTPASLLGLTEGSYEAYCLNQAVWYFGSTVQAELENAGQPKSKGSGKAESARKRILAKYFDDGKTKGQFADPSVMFKK